MAEHYNRGVTTAANTSDLLLLQQIRIGATVLECGCAAGYMTRYLQEQLQADVFIVEKDRDGFDRARQYAVDGVCADLEQTDAWSTHFGDLRFDYILFADVLEHLHDPVKVLEKAGELLKADGVLLASVPNVAHTDILLNLYKNSWNYQPFGLLDDAHIHFFGRENIRDQLTDSGFTLLCMDYVIRPPFQTEQANGGISAADMPVVDAICRRPYADVYQFVLTAKKANTAGEDVPYTDRYEERHNQYGALPNCCIAYLDEVQQQKIAREKAEQQALEKYKERCAECDQLQQACSTYAERNKKLLKEKKRLEDKVQTIAEEACAEYKAAYETISNAFFWKITKPFRCMVDGMKKLFRKSKTAHMVWKGMKCLKQNGVRYTWEKVKNRGKNDKKKVAVAQNTTAQEALARIFYVPGEPITILTTKHTLYVAHLIEKCLKRLWIPVKIITEEPETYSSELHFVICPQIFRHIPDRYIAVQMEQTVSSRWMTDRYFDILRNAYAILDYSLVNIRYFKEQSDIGHMFYYLPIDYLSDCVRPQSETEYDVVFYGDINNPRRRMMLDELSSTFHVKVLSEVFGETLYEELSKAKVVVNLHYYENAMLETTRLYEVLSLGTSIVVSERSSDSTEEERLEGIVDFVDVGDVEQLKAHIAHWLDDEDERRTQVEKNNRLLSDRVSAFDYYFYRFLLANGWLTFDHFYNLVGDFVHFNGNRVCLSLAEAVDRREEFDADNHYGFEVFPGLRHIRGWTGCGLSYKFIMKKAQEQGLKQLLVCEDDVFFPEDFEERFEHCRAYLAEHKDWNIFQGLMADVGDVTVSQVDHERGQTFVHIDHMISTVFNLYDEKVYPYFAGWDESNRNVHTNTIDRALEAEDLRIIATAPFLVGHKEELDSTVWGFNNSQYSAMISKSSEKLERLAREFEEKQESDDSEQNRSTENRVSL